jgi:DNA-binding transcriptional ArsR family regulator
MSAAVVKIMRPELVLSAAQVRCLASPVRTAILSHIRSGGTFSARKLSSLMGVPLKRLYYHLHELFAAGLICVRATRFKRGQEERLYGRVARRYIIRPNPRDRAYLEAAADKVDATCRLAARENRRALNAAVDHPALLDQMLLLRLDVCLDKATVSKIMRALEQAADLARQGHSPDNEQRISLTALVLPLVKPKRH